MTASGVHVRPIQIRDLVRLHSMRTDAIMPDQYQGPLRQRMADPRAVLPFSRRGRKSFVAVADGRVAGLIDLISDPANHRWLVSRVLTSRHVEADENEHLRDMIWRELALQAIRAAGAARAKRIHAVFNDDSPVVSALLSTGFSEYARDTVLSLATLDGIEAPGLVRRQDPSDVWAIHQLYHQVTPKPVQYAEALTSNYWSRALPGQPPARGYVVEDGLEIIAHCRVVRGCDGPIIHLMVNPETLDLIAPVIQDVLVDLGTSAGRVFSIVVPDYLQEYISHLESIGFVQTGRQTRMVKYTVVAQRMQFRSVEEMAKEVPERAAAGSPTLSYSRSGQRRNITDESDTYQGTYGIS